ncbi:AAA-like domain-containing protein [Brasilonema sp. UFV-L1]|uniref:AAA-like domain-containing protein n=1 Tax=Brasilonema sp. UFV-L1 TaxID=2234130 RepID=UPI00145F9349|nr:AAA-like domain-containing protein [Brasilonema sp. UFV-L1]NMG10838.1 serine/threonine protein kinase [Brasilonema sp. UFV-L1]
MTSIEQIIESTEALILDKTGKSLSFIQKIVLSESISETKKTYAQIATENNYSETYIKQIVAPKLWQLLSEALGEKVNRTNCRAVLEQRLNTSSLQTTSKPAQMQRKIALESPEGQVPLSSTLYIERNLEQICYQEILQPRALIRIKAPRKMGKTSLMTRILAYGRLHNYHTVRLSLHRAETEVFTSLEKFLRWFCANVTHQLGLESKLEDYWDEEIGALMNCTIYFQGYLLQQISSSVILALDEVNKLFEYPKLARDFLALLRSWHEETRDISIWQKIRLVIVQSTDIYIALDINKSPFNIGLVIDLPPFTRFQVEDLAQRHGLQMTYSVLEQLIELTGGFPYLVRLALYQIVHGEILLENLLQNARNHTAIFSNHLQEQLSYLQQNTDLADAFQQVIMTTKPITLEQQIAFQLKSLGLVHLSGRQATVSCGLYREYFSAGV